MINNHNIYPDELSFDVFSSRSFSLPYLFLKIFFYISFNSLLLFIYLVLCNMYFVKEEELYGISLLFADTSFVLTNDFQDKLYI